MPNKIIEIPGQKPKKIIEQYECACEINATCWPIIAKDRAYVDVSFIFERVPCLYIKLSGRLSL